LPGAVEAAAVSTQTLSANGQTLRYTATAGHLIARDPAGVAQASVFYVAYTLPGADPATRPVTFLYNGGPGSASVWLQLGSFGPKRPVLLVWMALARGIAPLNDLQQRIRARDSDDLSAIDEREAPEEVAPLVGAINDLLARQHSAMQTQKRFLADAAHQLKTPLAGLRTQAELAQREIDRGERDPAAIKTSLQQMARATQGAARMVNQLLSMARTDARSLAARREPVALDELAKEVVRDFVPRAMDKHIDLGYEGTPAGTPARHTETLLEMFDAHNMPMPSVFPLIDAIYFNPCMVRAGCCWCSAGKGSLCV